jgi:hypothetical protein
MENAQRVLSCLLHLLMDTAPHQRWDFVCGDFGISDSPVGRRCLRLRTRVRVRVRVREPLDISTTYDLGVSVCCFRLPDSHLWLRWLKIRTLHPGFKVGSSFEDFRPNSQR